MFKEYTDYDAMGLAELIKTGQVSPVEVLESAIAQIEKFNPKINAVIYKMYEYGKEEVKKVKNSQPLAGVPFLVKDLNVEIAGFPTSCGSVLTKNHNAPADSEIFTRYRNAGLVTLGKTNVPEFGIQPVTEPTLWGACRNPWNLNLTSGGSSGGSAAAVAARMVPIAYADDGGGSIRIPSSACGLFGFKPSRGLQPLGPHRNEGWLSLSSGHVVTRSVRDSALALDLTQGLGLGAAYGPVRTPNNFIQSETLSIAGKTVAFTRESLFGKNISPECLRALDQTLKVCESLGLTVIEAKPSLNKEELLFSFYVILAASVAGEVARNEKLMQTTARLGHIEYVTWFLKVMGEKLRASHLEAAIHNMRQTTIQWEQFFSHYDFFCSPTLAFEPPPLGLLNLNFFEKLTVRISEYLPSSILVSLLHRMGNHSIENNPNTFIFNMSGHPAMSIPAYWTPSEVPIGVQFATRMGYDDQLFALAFELEKALQWSAKKPNLLHPNDF